MYGLGLRLTLRSGREPFIRLVVTAVAVAIGVAIMLCVMADFHAFSVASNRPSWESTQGTTLTTDYRANSDAVLWNYSNDIYHGQTIERLDVAGLGPGAPAPPGITRLPVAGQYYASPALAALIRTVPADQLGDRFPGHLAGSVGNQALTGPDELVIYVGYQPAQLASLPATTLVTRISTAPGQQIWTHYFRDAFIVAALAFLLPILILVGTAVRLAAARREERYAALRLVGATMDQIAVISSVDAIASALLGALLGIVIFLLLQPWLAGTAITSERYFAADVTPTMVEYLIVVIGVPAASAVSSLISLQRVRISPLCVSRRVTPQAPTVWRLVTLGVGVLLFITGIATTTTRQIGQFTFPGLLFTMIGLVAAGPYLTAQAAALLRRLTGSAAGLLASRRLSDNPRLAFRAVSGLVLAVFLGTIVGGILPAVESTSASAQASKLTNVLMDEFVSAPLCGNNVNCTNGDQGPAANPLAGPTAQLQRISVAGLPPQSAAGLLAGLRGIPGVTVVPVWSPAGSGQAAAEQGPGGTGIISCAGLRAVAALGQCAPGVTNVEVPAANIFGDNPRYSTQPIASAGSPAYAGSLAGLYLQSVLVKAANASVVEQARTYLVTHSAQSQSGTAARTFGEAMQPRAAVASTVERLIYLGVLLTLIVAGCSLAVTVAGGLIERKRPFTLLRLSGTPVRTLYRVVLIEALLPLVAAIVIAGGLAYLIAVLTVLGIAPAGTPVPVPGHAYFLMMGGGLLGALAVIAAALPLLGRITSTASVRFEEGQLARAPAGTIGGQGQESRRVTRSFTR
jgi:hypothetical protein